MPEEKPKPDQTPPAHIMAAKKGCVQCCGRLRVPPAGPPFAQGPHAGRYLCADCWTLYYAANPESLADADTKAFIADEARKILLRRQASVLFEEGPIRVFMSPRGTVVFEIKSSPDLSPFEFDSEKLAWLTKAVTAIQAKIPAAGTETILK